MGFNKATPSLSRACTSPLTPARGHYSQAGEAGQSQQRSVQHRAVRLLVLNLTDVGVFDQQLVLRECETELCQGSGEGADNCQVRGP